MCLGTIASGALDTVLLFLVNEFRRAEIMLTLGPDDQGATDFEWPETIFSHFGYVSDSNPLTHGPILSLEEIFRGPTFPDLFQT